MNHQHPSHHHAKENEQQHNCCHHSEAVQKPIPAPGAPVMYTCPMHPEIRQEKPGNCPLCGMALEPESISLQEEQNPEYVDMRWRLWVGLFLSLPVLILAMGEHLLPVIPDNSSVWIQLILATPVVLWCGWPFLFVLGIL